MGDGVLRPQAPGPYTHLRLAGPRGFVQLNALHLAQADVIDIARTMRRRLPPEPGWDLPSLPGGFRPFAESGDAPRALRQLLWRGDDGSLLAELTVSSEYSTAVTTGWHADAAVDTINIDGWTAVVSESSGRVAISWPLGDDHVQALFGFAGDRSTAESIVRSIAMADERAWRNLTEPRAPGSDGCQSLFC